MTEFSQKRFVDLGQTLYVEWLKTVIKIPVSNLHSFTEEKRRQIFNVGAQYAFEAAEEFAEVFRNQDVN